MKPQMVADKDLLMKWLFFSARNGDSALVDFKTFVTEDLGLEERFCAPLRSQLHGLREQFDNGDVSRDANGELVFDLCHMLWARLDISKDIRRLEKSSLRIIENIGRILKTSTNTLIDIKKLFIEFVEYQYDLYFLYSQSIDSEPELKGKTTPDSNQADDFEVFDISEILGLLNNTAQFYSIIRDRVELAEFWGNYKKLADIYHYQFGFEEPEEVSETTSTSTTDSDTADTGSDGFHFDKNTILEQCIEKLYAKRGSTREKVLRTIIEAFNCNIDGFEERKSATLFWQCISSIIRGSSEEIALASHVIGLLALTAGPGDKACKILEESVCHITKAIKSGSDTSEISSLVECLAVITFVAGEELGETEKSMQTIWQIIHPELELGPNVAAPLITTVVSSWTFVLTSMNRWTLKPKGWEGSVSYLSTLLDNEDISVRVAAGEALALFFEFKNLARESLELQGLRAKILKQVRALSAEAGCEQSARKDLKHQDTFRDILEFLESGCSPETSIKIGEESLNPSNWAKLIQLKFLQKFLGRGFEEQIQDNDFLREIFCFTPKKLL